LRAYRLTRCDAVLRRHEANAPVAPTDSGLHALQQAVVGRLMRMLARLGVRIEAVDQACLADPDVANARTVR